MYHYSILKIFLFIDRVFNFEDAIAAMLYLKKGRSRGKVVLKMK